MHLFSIGINVRNPQPHGCDNEHLQTLLWPGSCQPLLHQYKQKATQEQEGPKKEIKGHLPNLERERERCSWTIQSQTLMTKQSQIFNGQSIGEPSFQVLNPSYQ